MDENGLIWNNRGELEEKRNHAEEVMIPFFFFFRNYRFCYQLNLDLLLLLRLSVEE